MLVAFLILATLIAVIYAGYPLVLLLLLLASRRRSQLPPPLANGDLPAAVLVIPVHNEEAVIERKLRNFLALDYPAGRLRAVVISDGSTDRTCSLVRGLRDSLDPGERARIELVERTGRSGKSIALSEEVPKLDAEILIFTDANAFYRRDAVRKLVAHFADPRVGLVCGRLRYVPEPDSFMSDEELYWRYEDMIKRWEGALGHLLVANGSIYALRSRLFEPIPGGVADDFVFPLLTAARGDRLVYEPSAVAEEQLPAQGIENFRAKARIVSRGLQAVRVYWREILRSGPARATQYLFHKLARWLIAFVLLGMLLTAAIGATDPVLAAAFTAQVAFYALGFSAYLLARIGPVPGVLRLPFYFLMVNAAAVVGLWGFLRGERRVIWEKSETTRRTWPEPAPPAPERRRWMGRRGSKRIRFAIATVLAFAGLLSIETAARFTYGVRELLQDWRGSAARATRLPPYEMADPAHPGGWRLRPGASMTLAAALELRAGQGRVERAQRLEAAGRKLGIGGDDVVFRVNSSGYKGPELDPSHTRPRILAAGGAETFGTLIDYYSYPRALERSLAGSGLAAEVVNAGVAGYSTAQILQRMKELEELHSEVTVLSLGSHELFRGRRVLAIPIERVYSIRAIRALWEWWRTRDLPEAGRAPIDLDPDPPELRVIERYRPPFLEDVVRIASEMKAGGSDVVLLTMPALHHSGERPSPRALEVGRVPQVLRGNPYLLAAFVARYNELLRETAVALGVELIDLEPWSRDALQPRWEYFDDSISLNEAGQEKLGQHLAQVLGERLRSRSD